VIALGFVGAASQPAAAQIAPGREKPNVATAPGRLDDSSDIIGESRSHRLRRSDDPPPSNPVNLRPLPDPAASLPSPRGSGADGDSPGRRRDTTGGDGVLDGSELGAGPNRAAAGQPQLGLTPLPDRFAPPPPRSRPAPEGDLR
jgi:hypothetical protein